VTTAATLWLMTVIGLCLGGGQLILGTAAAVLAVLILWALKWVDVMIPREHRARLVICCVAQWSVLEEVPRLVEPMKYRARFQEQRGSPDSENTDYVFELSWRRPERASPPVELLEIIDRHFPVKSFELTTDNGR
jgi:putative Mg2+ transporter-C (MgtC) family protein